METVTLTKAWLGHEPGDTVQVDPERAAWMRENGYALSREPKSDDLPPILEPVTRRPANKRAAVEETKAPTVVPDLKIPTQD